MSSLEEMLHYVSEHNEYYKKIIRENHITDPTDITQYPVLTRQQLQENRYNMFSDGYKLKYYNQQLRRQTSSGSTGVPVNVYWDYKDWYASNLLLWRKRWAWYNIKPTSKRVMFTLKAFETGNQDGAVQYMISPENVLTFNISLVHTIDDYVTICKVMQSFDPEWLYIQPHILNNILIVFENTPKFSFKSLKYIETVGETLSSTLKQRTVNAFLVPLADMYGSEEMNGIAYECPHHHMHILSGNVYVEVMQGDGEIRKRGEGTAVITNLNNHAMPLIRYLQGDALLLPNENRKECIGTSNDIIGQIKGRSIERIDLSGGNTISAYTLSEVISDVNNRFSDIIIEYHYIYYQNMNKLICYIVLEKKRLSWASNVIATMEQSLSVKISAKAKINFEVRVVNNLALSQEKLGILEKM